MTLRGKAINLPIATNRPEEFTYTILRHLNLEQIFDCVLCGDKVSRAKPAPDIMEQILKKFSLSPENALYVGDMTIDVETGHAVGMKTIAVITGSSSREDIIALKPFKVVSRISEIIDIIEDISVLTKT